jgi:hypothetical protein
MRSSIKPHLGAFGVALSAAAFTICLAATSPASAQQQESRDAAWQRCTNVAQMQYPNPESTSGRVAVFKSCMSQAGYRP